MHRMIIRVDMVGTNHDKVLTQWKHMPMGQFRANISLIRITSNYFWALEVFKNQRFKSHLFSFFLYKKYPKLKTWVKISEALYIGLHCVNRSLWIATTLATLLVIFCIWKCSYVNQKFSFECSDYCQNWPSKL